ncbi:MAG: sulfite exporter TauE/SafE family protein [Rhodospirillales bacterium]|nr:sulfite exporter TauE/SafE family protein [Rhodospirillales bacterium]
MNVSTIVLAVAGLLAGMMNSLAGGGSFLTFPALLLAGLDPRAANITSSIALFPSQAAAGWAGRGMAAGAAGLSLQMLIIVSLIGGALGAMLLLATPVSFFTHLVPWLILFATLVFIWGSFFRRKQAKDEKPPISPRVALALQFAIAVYGGYFGGGIGFLMLAALTAVGVAVRAAGATKNALAGIMNVAAVAIFLARSKQNWVLVLVLGIAAMVGAQIGVVLLRRVPEKILRLVVSFIGIALTIGMFLRS